MQKYSSYILIGLLGLIVFISYKACHDKDITINRYKSQIEFLEQENEKLDTVIQSLDLVIDSLSKEVGVIDSVIVEVRTEYEKDFIDIVNQPIASDVEFFKGYLSENSSRLFDSNNSNSVKTN